MTQRSVYARIESQRRLTITMVTMQGEEGRCAGWCVLPLTGDGCRVTAVPRHSETRSAEPTWQLTEAGRHAAVT